jgi:hypothetical protein
MVMQVISLGQWVSNFALPGSFSAIKYFRELSKPTLLIY